MSGTLLGKYLIFYKLVGRLIMQMRNGVYLLTLIRNP